VGGARSKEGAESRYFLFPEKLYGRACAIDPSEECFSQWLRWTSGQSVYERERVAAEWHRIRKSDMEPILFLMEETEKRGAFPTALSYLEKAERIDPVNSVVRAARLRLLVAGAMRHLQQKKPHLAAEKLAALEALPQARQGDRPAFLAALRFHVLNSSGDKAGLETTLAETARLMGGELAARLLIFAIASVSKRLSSFSVLPVHLLSKQQRSEIPGSLAKLAAICRDLGIRKYGLPVGYVEEAEAQFPRVCGSLNAEQVLSLGKVAVAMQHPRLAWAASGAGLKLGGPLEAQFMLLRAQAVPQGHGQRYLATAAAAVELGRVHGDANVVGAAIEIVRNPLGGDSISLTLDQARDVVRKEVASPDFPGRVSRDPDYSDLMPRRELCQCPECRAARGEIPSPFDDDDDFDEDDDDPFGGLPPRELEGMLRDTIPEGLPPELSKVLVEVMKEAFVTGETPEQIMARVLNGFKPGKRKGRRK
jgi:hypothetical protein